MENQEQIIEKIRNYLEEKLGLNISDCYILTSLLSKSYLEEIEIEDDAELDELDSGEENDDGDTDSEEDGEEVTG